MILVTGGAGFLGAHIVREAARTDRVMATFLSHPPADKNIPSVPMDLSSESSIRSVIDSARPSIIIHAAAAKDVDACEKDPDMAHRINVRGTEILCDAAGTHGCRVIFISTDLVYDGAHSLWKESDPARSASVYAKTKRAAEGITLSRAGNVAVRIALLYGWSDPDHPTFIESMVAALQGNRSITLFTDQYRTPILVEEAAGAILQLAREPGLTGLFNLGGPRRVSRHEFGMAFCRCFSFDPGLVQARRMAEVPAHIPRPADCSMDSRKIVHALGLRLSDVDAGLVTLHRNRDRKRVL